MQLREEINVSTHVARRGHKTSEPGKQESLLERSKLNSKTDSN